MKMHQKLIYIPYSVSLFRILCLNNDHNFKKIFEKEITLKKYYYWLILFMCINICCLPPTMCVIMRWMCKHDDYTHADHQLSLTLTWTHRVMTVLLNTLQLQTSAQSTMVAVTWMQTVTRRGWSSTAPVRLVTKETATPANPSTGGRGTYFSMN